MASQHRVSCGSQVATITCPTESGDAALLQRSHEASRRRLGRAARSSCVAGR